MPSILSMSSDYRSNLTAPAEGALLACRGLTKSYRMGKVEVPVLRGVDLEVASGEFLAIVGQSGSGKSTLLHLLGMLDRPNEGEIWFDGKQIDQAGRRYYNGLRTEEIGLVFQAYHLLPELSAIENVLAPAMIRYGIFAYMKRRRALRQRAHDLLELVGLGHRVKHKPCELSGGEMQRTAIARSLMNHPRLLLADEPTGNLDRSTGEGVLELLHQLKSEPLLNAEHGLTIVMVTHDQSIAERADRTVTLDEGRVATTAVASHSRHA